MHKTKVNTPAQTPALTQVKCEAQTCQVIKSLCMRVWCVCVCFGPGGCAGGEEMPTSRGFNSILRGKK